jgi:uncharacterized protein (DUF2345 family)
MMGRNVWLGLPLVLGGIMLAGVAEPVGAQRGGVSDELAAQSRKIAALEAELAALRMLVVAGPRGSLALGGPRSDRVELRARGSAIVLENDQVTITGKRVTINGVTITIKGDNIALDAPDIAVKGSGAAVIKGSKIGGN